MILTFAKVYAIPPNFSVHLFFESIERFHNENIVLKGVCMGDMIQSEIVAIKIVMRSSFFSYGTTMYTVLSVCVVVPNLRYEHKKKFPKPLTGYNGSPHHD